MMINDGDHACTYLFGKVLWGYSSDPANDIVHVGVNFLLQLG